MRVASCEGVGSEGERDKRNGGESEEVRGRERESEGVRGERE